MADVLFELINQNIKTNLKNEPPLSPKKKGVN